MVNIHQVIDERKDELFELLSSFIKFIDVSIDDNYNIKIENINFYCCTYYLSHFFIYTLLFLC